MVPLYSPAGGGGSSRAMFPTVPRRSGGGRQSLPACARRRPSDTSPLVALATLARPPPPTRSHARRRRDFRRFSSFLKHNFLPRFSRVYFSLQNGGHSSPPPRTCHPPYLSDGGRSERCRSKRRSDAGAPHRRRRRANAAGRAADVCDAVLPTDGRGRRQFRYVLLLDSETL